MPNSTRFCRSTRDKLVATQKEKIAEDIFMRSIADLPGNANYMVVLNKTRHGKVKILSNTRIDDLPTRILRDIKEDLNWAREQQVARARAFSSLFRSNQNGEPKNRKASTKRLRTQRASKKKKTS